MAKITRSEAAKLIKSALETDEKENYSVTVWEKGGKVRCYLKDLGYTNKQDRGFFAFNSDGTPHWAGLERGTGHAIEVIKSVLADLEVLPDSDSLLPQRISQEEADKLASRPRHRQESAEKALDRIYGKGNWDKWDREDYEG